MIDTEPSITATEYSFLREEIRHEDNLINQRLSWLVSSQSFLLTGFAISLNGPIQTKLPAYDRLNTALVAWLPVAGVLTDVVSCVTIMAALLHMRDIRRLAGESHPQHFPSVQGTALTRAMGLSGPVATPFIFLVVWLALLLHR